MVVCGLPDLACQYTQAIFRHIYCKRMYRRNIILILHNEATAQNQCDLTLLFTFADAFSLCVHAYFHRAQIGQWICHQCVVLAVSVAGGFSLVGVRLNCSRSFESTQNNSVNAAKRIPILGSMCIRWALKMKCFFCRSTNCTVFYCSERFSSYVCVAFSISRRVCCCLRNAHKMVLHIACSGLWATLEIGFVFHYV